MLTYRELDEMRLEAQARLKEILEEYQRVKMGERANYMTPEEVTNAGYETNAQDYLRGA